MIQHNGGFMDPVTKQQKQPIAKESDQIEHFRKKMGKNMARLEEKTRGLSRNVMARLDEQYSNNPFKGQIAPDSEETLKVQKFIFGGNQR